MVVSRRSAGLGDCLVSLLAAWRYAQDTARTLVVDWRRSRYALDPRRNAFPLFFEPPDALGGVPIVADDRVGLLDSVEPVRPGGLERLSSAERERALRDAALGLIRSAADVAAPVVVLEGCLVEAGPPPDVQRRLLLELRPVAAARDAAEAFASSRLDGRPVVGVHVRHGNGGDVLGHAPYWADIDAALATVAAAIARARSTLGPDAVVYLATDSEMVAARLAAAVPRPVTRPKPFRPIGVGELHLGPLRGVGRLDALVEMLLLARSDVLVRYPPDSFFSVWASLTKRSTPESGVPRAVELVNGPLGARVEW